MMMMRRRTQNFLFNVFLTYTDLCTHRVDFQPIVESFLLHCFLYRTCRNVAGLSSLRASCVNSAKPSPCSSTCSHWCIALLISSSLSWYSWVTRFRSSTFLFSMMAINESHSLLTWASTSQPDFCKFKKCQLYLHRCNRDIPRVGSTRGRIETPTAGE